MPDSLSKNCVLAHFSKFFDIVDKLSEMEIKIYYDLLILMMPYRFPPQITKIFFLLSNPEINYLNHNNFEL